MPFIKLRKVKMSSDGTVLSGSAGLIDTVYVKGKASHSRQILRENLGKVIWMAQNHRSGIFLSPSRGLIEYSADQDKFSEVDRGDLRLPKDRTFPDPPVHSIFGDVFLIVSFLNNSPLLKALKQTFFNKLDLQRVLIHLVHTVAKDGSHINCQDFTARSFMGSLFLDIPQCSLKSDTYYFEIMGDDATRTTFFECYVKEMRRFYPGFGKGCYVDSTPLPNDIVDNPFNALCCHGVSGSTVMTRLVMILDEQTDLPVWYDIIPGNVIDLNTILYVMEDVKITLDIEIDDFVLDAGYASKELFTAYHIGTEKKFIVRCPARRGYHTQTIYREIKSMMPRGKYEFVRDRHLYFGFRKKVKLFGQPVYYYIYVDKNNALQHHREAVMKDPERFKKMSDKDKDWESVRYGYFILISNYDATPEEILDNYFNRVDIELAFRTAKEYLQLLPLSKWTDKTVRGKILNDVISLIVYCGIREKISPSGESMPSVFGKVSSLMCLVDHNEIAHIETPTKKVKEFAKLLDIEIPGTLDVKNLQRSLLTNQ